MTKDEFKFIVKGMKAVYPQPTFIPDNDAFNIWFNLLKDIDYNLCSVAVQTYISTEKFPPTIADIREKAFTTTNVNQISEMEAWDMVRKAIADSSYHSEERFNEFTDDIKRAVGSPSQLRIWATDSEFNDSVVQSNFMRSYKTVVSRAETMSRLPQSIRERLATNENYQRLIGD